MLLINKLTNPGDIRRVEIRPDTIRVKTRDGKSRLYELVSTLSDNLTAVGISKDKGVSNVDRKRVSVANTR